MLFLRSGMHTVDDIGDILPGLPPVYAINRQGGALCRGPLSELPHVPTTLQNGLGSEMSGGEIRLQVSLHRIAPMQCVQERRALRLVPEAISGLLRRPSGQLVGTGRAIWTVLSLIRYGGNCLPDEDSALPCRQGRYRRGFS